MEDMRERETLREGAEELVMAEKERIQGVRCSGSFTLHGFFSSIGGRTLSFSLNYLFCMQE